MGASGLEKTIYENSLPDDCSSDQLTKLDTCGGGSLVILDPNPFPHPGLYNINIYIGGII